LLPLCFPFPEVDFQYLSPLLAFPSDCCTFVWMRSEAQRRWESVSTLGALHFRPCPLSSLVISAPFPSGPLIKGYSFVSSLFSSRALPAQARENLRGPFSDVGKSRAAVPSLFPPPPFLSQSTPPYPRPPLLGSLQRRLRGGQSRIFFARLERSGTLSTGPSPFFSKLSFLLPFIRDPASRIWPHKSSLFVSFTAPVFASQRRPRYHPFDLRRVFFFLPGDRIFLLMPPSSLSPNRGLFVLPAANLFPLKGTPLGGRSPPSYGFPFTSPPT